MKPHLVGHRGQAEVAPTVLVGLLQYIAVAVANASRAEAFINLILLVVSVVFGVKGNAWREDHLVSRGYEMVDTVTAATAEGAVALCLKSAGTNSG